MFGKTVILGDGVWSCWVDVLLLGFSHTFWFLGWYGDCVLSGTEFFWDPGKFDDWGFWQNVFLGIECRYLVMRMDWGSVGAQG